MRVSLIGLAQNAAGELERIFRRNETHRKQRTDCDCRICCDVDHTGAYAFALRELAGNATKLKDDPALLGDFLHCYALGGGQPETGERNTKLHATLRRLFDAIKPYGGIGHEGSELLEAMCEARALLDERTPATTKRTA
jgi:hypothetical protein